MPERVKKRLVPPEEMKGNGIPLVGQPSRKIKKATAGPSTALRSARDDSRRWWTGIQWLKVAAPYGRFERFQCSKSRSFAYHPHALPQRATSLFGDPMKKARGAPCAQDDSIV